MTIPISMPKIGLTMAEGKIVEWKKNEGQWVEKGEILFVFETEKVTFEVEAQQSGFLAKILVQVDAVASVGKPVAILTGRRDEPVDLTPGGSKETSARAEERSVHIGADKPRKIRATPMARKLARERGIDLEGLALPDEGKRIRMKDLEASCADWKPLGQAVSAVEGETAGEIRAPGSDSGRLVKLSGMRRAIAEKMLASKTQAAQTYMVVSVNAEKLLEVKEKLKEYAMRTSGVHLTITDILMKIAAAAIALHPVMNTRWSPDGIIWLDVVDMGMAVALDEGLIVPVIRDIGKKSLSEIAAERAELVEKGKAGKLTPDEMRDGTFTVSSLGMFGVEEFTAIINQPESAILAVGAIVDKPVVEGKQVVIRPVMKLTLSYDHRIIDGAKAAAFTKTLKELIEYPVLTLA